jgi:hypothetical protein
MANETQESTGAQYELTEPAYIDDEYLEAGRVITYPGKPGHHMKPVNAEAKAQVKKHYPSGMPGYRDPIEALAQI